MEGLSNFPDEIFLEDVEQLRKEYASAQAAASSGGQCSAGPSQTVEAKCVDYADVDFTR